MDYIIAAQTDPGLVKNINQDCFSVRAFNTPQGNMVFAVLCDGMGGFSHGEIASASVVKAFNDWADARLEDLTRAPISDYDIRREWIDVVGKSNTGILTYAALNGISQMGTTLVAMLITGTRYYIINVGDSRAYRFYLRSDLLTQDQSIVAAEIRAGRLTEDEAENDPRRNQLLQCIGACSAVYPDMYFGDVGPGMVFMLCSDGFRHEVSSDEMFALLGPSRIHNSDDMNRNMRRLIDLNMERGEKDNISVVAVKTES